MKCPKCASLENVKAGFNNNKQRYKCKECECFYTRSTPKGYSKRTKRKAIQLYLEGLGFRSIARFLKVSHVAVQIWVREAAENLETLVPLYPARAEIVELDEMHHYVGKKNTKSGYGLLVCIDDAEQSQPKWVAVDTKPE